MFHTHINAHPHLHTPSHLDTPSHLHTLTPSRPHTEHNICVHRCWFCNQCGQYHPACNIPVWTELWFQVRHVTSCFPHPPPTPPPQGCSFCYDPNPECIAAISAGLYMGLGTPQADLGRVELGEPSGLVDLRQTGHPGPPDGRL